MCGTDTQGCLVHVDETQRGVTKQRCVLYREVVQDVLVVRLDGLMLREGHQIQLV